MTSASPSPVVRRALAAAIAVPVALALTVVLAGPAAAGTPESWPESDQVDFVSMILLFVGVPLLVFVLVAALVLGPSLARGESISPGANEQESQWIGGPRKATGELAAPDAEGSQAGGAGGRW